MGFDGFKSTYRTVSHNQMVTELDEPWSPQDVPFAEAPRWRFHSIPSAVALSQRAVKGDRWPGNAPTWEN